MSPLGFDFTIPVLSGRWHCDRPATPLPYFNVKLITKCASRPPELGVQLASLWLYLFRTCSCEQNETRVTCLCLFITCWTTCVRIGLCTKYVKRLCIYRYTNAGARRSALVKALCCKPQGRGFETRWGEWKFSVYIILPAPLNPGVYSACDRNEYHKQK
jgi:hypothetical protein